MNYNRSILILYLKYTETVFILIRVFLHQRSIVEVYCSKHCVTQISQLDSLCFKIEPWDDHCDIQNLGSHKVYRNEGQTVAELELEDASTV